MRITMGVASNYSNVYEDNKISTLAVQKVCVKRRKERIICGDEERKI